MANTATVVVNENGDRTQFMSLFSAMYAATATITDQDAISANDTAAFAVTVPGVAFGDMVLVAHSADQSDGTDDAVMYGVVTAADTVEIRVQADAGAYAADDLNNSTVKVLVLRPNW